MQTTAPTSIPVVERPESRVAGHIREAAETTGVPFDFLLAQANQESRLNPEAKNRRSSAMGLFQFTAGTWLEMVKKHGAEHGLDQYADAITKGSDGRWTVKGKDLKKEILDLRRDPRLSALMAGEYAKDNEQVLESKLGRKASTHDLYLAHFLGAGGALRLLKSHQQPDAEHPAEMADAARANPELFHDQESGERRSLNTVYRMVEKQFRRAMAEASAVAHSLRPQVDLANIRPEERPEGEAAGDAAGEESFAAALPAPEPVVPPQMKLAVAPPSDLAELRPQPRPPEEPVSELTALRPEPRPAEEVDIAATPTTIRPAAEALALAAQVLAMGSSSGSPFPTRLPPRPEAAASLRFPVALPPPVAGIRADSATLQGLLNAMEDKG